MNEVEKKKNAKDFAEYWKGKGYEKGESQKFWIDLLEHVLNIENARDYIEFEKQAKIDTSNGFIDGYIASTRVLIEQKGARIDLRKGIRQSDGSLLSPFLQAKRYIVEMPVDKHPRWVITCNFQEFLIYDMNKPNGEPESILLKDLVKEYYRLQFIVNSENENIKKEMEISIKAGELVGVLYDSLLEQYKEKTEESLKSLNMLCVRIVFCLYAEDSNLFGEKLAFHNYIQSHSVKDVRRALIDLFKVLDTKIENRDKYINEDLAKFPYVNGGLFANEDIEIPQFNEEIVNILLHNASEDFDWSEISPTIFGAVFESTLNPETRRSGGMHYTSIENIHKVIDPLFLNDLKEELVKIKEVKVDKTKKQQLEEFRKKLGTLTFLDPACGSGNFLTETYISLRRLENEALLLQTRGQMILGFDDIIKVSLKQFYGIEINDFAVTVAKTALWISESQMMKETEVIINRQLEFFPLKSYANIIEGNALRIDWNEVVPKQKLNYIMGNPPFVGSSLKNKEQTQDMNNLFVSIKNYGKIDYVAAWYKKASMYIYGTKIEVAFVSTNSITQGEQVLPLWKVLLDKGLVINFAYQSFKWTSESSKTAGVVCIIIGFSFVEREKKQLFSNGIVKNVEHINAYLLNAPDVYIESRGTVLTSGLPKMTQGNKPWDGGHLLLTEDEKVSLIKKYPETVEIIKRFIGSNELINNKKRYCLWLKNISPNMYRNIPEIMERLKKVSETRKATKTVAVQEQANMPMLFSQIRQPDQTYLAIPEVSADSRRYIPIAFLDKEIIASNKLYFIKTHNSYIFGILESNVHMSWMRVVAGRLGLGYSYSPSVYNNFPWPTITKEHKEKIEQTAKAILDARKLYPDSSLADLYDELTMPKELRKAHQENDKAVMQAYGFPIKITESECVAELFKLYSKLVKNN